MDFNKQLMLELSQGRQAAACKSNCQLRDIPEERQALLSANRFSLMCSEALYFGSICSDHVC